MSTLAVTHPTLLDLSKRMDENGKIASIIEILDQSNEILDDMVWIEANQVTGHKTTIRSGLPSPTYRKLYGGVQPAKSRTVQITDNCGMLEQYAEIDKALADLNGNTAAWRLSEELPFIEGFNQKVTTDLFTADELVTPEAFTGLVPRFNSTSAENASNIIIDSSVSSGEATTSEIWLVVWGPNTCHMIYPKGSQAGLMIEDKGQVTVENVDGSNGRAEMYRTHYRQDVGLCVRDWRYVSRGLFDASDFVKSAATGPDLLDLMARMLEVIPNINAGRAAFYCSRQTRGMIRRQIANRTVNSTLTIEQITRANGARVHVPMFDGIPIRRVDTLTSVTAPTF